MLGNLFQATKTIAFQSSLLDNVRVCVVDCGHTVLGLSCTSVSMPCQMVTSCFVMEHNCKTRFLNLEIAGKIMQLKCSDKLILL